MNMSTSKRFAVISLSASAVLGVAVTIGIATQPSAQPSIASPRAPTVAQLTSEQPVPPDRRAPLVAVMPPLPPMPLAPSRPVPEPIEVLAVRREIKALRMACAAMSPRTYIASPQPMRISSVDVPPPISLRPYALEEDTCDTVLSPDRAGPGYAVQLGMIGAGLTLLALLFFTLIGGLVRVLWNGPMARAIPMLLPSRFHG